jgi:hypothetical protein
MHRASDLRSTVKVPLSRRATKLSTSARCQLPLPANRQCRRGELAGDVRNASPGRVELKTGRAKRVSAWRSRDELEPVKVARLWKHILLYGFAHKEASPRLWADEGGLILLLSGDRRLPVRRRFPSKRCATLALPRRLRMGGNKSFPHLLSHLAALAWRRLQPRVHAATDF